MARSPVFAAIVTEPLFVDPFSVPPPERLVTLMTEPLSLAVKSKVPPTTRLPTKTWLPSELVVTSSALTVPMVCMPPTPALRIRSPPPEKVMAVP